MTRKALGKLLTPSWLSGLVAITIGLAVVAGVAFTIHYNGSSLQLIRNQADKPRTITENSDSVNSELASSQFISNALIFLLWAGVGLMAYWLVTQVVSILGHVVDLEHELHYVHADRNQLLRQAFLKFGLRICFLLIWLLYMKFTIHVLIPYAIALVYAGSGMLGWLPDIGYLLAAAALLAVGMHLHTIMLRLVLLRSRAFGQIY